MKKQIEKIELKRFFNAVAINKELKKKVKQIKAVNRKEKGKVYKSYISTDDNTFVKQVIDDSRNFLKLDYEDKVNLVYSFNKCVDIANKYITQKKEPTVEIRFIKGSNSGIVTSYNKSVAEDFVKDSLAELV